MSILDGMPQSDADMKFVVASASTIVETVLGLSAKTPRAQSILEAMREGLSLADILKIPKDERDALLAQGIRQMQVGDVAGAQATLTTLYYLEPLDARAIYALATTHQAQGNHGAAGRLYVAFLALDATSADGYLRLAECFMANRETEQARACFEVGKGEALSAGQSDRVAHADRMLALLGGPTEHAA